MTQAHQIQLAEREWTDGRFWFSLILIPPGLLLWANTAFIAIKVLLQIPQDDLSLSREVGLYLMLGFGFFSSLWFVIGIIQAYFLEPQQIFIVRWARYRNGIFDLKGYYFKEARFEGREVAAVDKHIESNNIFAQAGNRTFGTNLTHDPRLKYNFNIKVTLQSGKVFYLPGRMFQKEGPEELLKRLKPDSVWLAELTTQSKPEEPLVPPHLAWAMSEEDKNAMVIRETLDSRAFPVEPAEAMDYTPKERVVEMLNKAPKRYTINGITFDVSKRND